MYNTAWLPLLKELGKHAYGTYAYVTFSDQL